MKKFILLIGTACLPLSVSYGVLTCGICKKFSCHKRQHMVIHLAHEHYLWFCPHCPKCIKGNERIKGNDIFKEHVTKTHGRRACLFCMTLTFENEEAYRSHKDAVHLPPMEYKWKCDACKKRLPTLERFVLHVFDERKLYVCPNCMQKNPDEANGKKSEFHMIGYKTEHEYLAHMLSEHKKHACSRCNMQVFKDQNELFEHWWKYRHMDESKGMGAPCKLCNHKFSCKADQEFHELQHAFLLFFLEQTIYGYTCCVPFHKAVADTYAEVKRLGKEKWDDTYVEKIIKPAIQAVIQAVCALATHVLTGHKRCLFCENPVTKESRKQLETKLGALTYRQIAKDARMFLQPNKNAFSESTIPVYPCDMCGSALQPNRKSRLFFASIAKFKLGEGLDVQDYPFYHLEYDELKVWKNTMMPVITEVPASEEETDVILGKEDENGEEEEEEEKEKEDKKEEKTEAELKKKK